MIDQKMTNQHLEKSVQILSASTRQNSLSLHLFAGSCNLCSRVTEDVRHHYGQNIW